MHSSPRCLAMARGMPATLLFIFASLCSDCCSGWTAAFLICWWVVKQPVCPPRLAGWSESGIPGISLPGSVSRVRRLILYINLDLVRYTPFLLLKVTKAVALKHTLALSGTPSQLWGSWDARNNWWWGRSCYLSMQDSMDLSHLPLRGIVPPTPFRLIAATSRPTLLCISLSAHDFKM